MLEGVQSGCEMRGPSLNELLIGLLLRFIVLSCGGKITIETGALARFLQMMRRSGHYHQTQ